MTRRVVKVGEIAEIIQFSRKGRKAAKVFFPLAETWRTRRIHTSHAKLAKPQRKGTQLTEASGEVRGQASHMSITSLIIPYLDLGGIDLRECINLLL